MSKTTNKPEKDALDEQAESNADPQTETAKHPFSEDDDTPPWGDEPERPMSDDELYAVHVRPARGDECDRCIRCLRENVSLRTLEQPNTNTIWWFCDDCYASWLAKEGRPLTFDELAQRQG